MARPLAKLTTREQRYTFIRSFWATYQRTKNRELARKRACQAAAEQRLAERRNAYPASTDAFNERTWNE